MRGVYALYEIIYPGGLKVQAQNKKTIKGEEFLTCDGDGDADAVGLCCGEGAGKNGTRFSE